MNLKHLKDSELLSQTKTLVQSERLLLTKVLHHLREVERRRLFSDLGYQSLFEYAVKELKYSEGQAGRRIQAMRLLKELPEIEGKIASGALSLSNISQAQSYFRSVQKKSSSRQISINLDSTQTDSFISQDGKAVSIGNSNLTKKTIDSESGISDSANYLSDKSKLLQNDFSTSNQPNVFSQPNQLSKSTNSDNTRNEAWPQILATKNDGLSDPNDHSLNKLEKLRLLESLENKSARDGQELILSIQPEALPHKERERVLSDDKTEIKFVITAELKTKLTELRALLGTKGATMSFSELINYMADVSIQETKIKKFGKKRVLEATGARKASSPLNKQGDLNANEAIKDIDKKVGRSSKEARVGGLKAKVTNKDVNNNCTLKNRKTGMGSVDQVVSMGKSLDSFRPPTTQMSELLRSNGKSSYQSKTVSSRTSNTKTSQAEVLSRLNSSATPTSELRREKKSSLSSFSSLGDKKDTLHSASRVGECIICAHNENQVDSISRGNTSNNLRYISQALRFEVWVRDGGQCTKCGSRRHLNIDHIKPLAIGGETSLNNLRLLCFHCNQRQAIKVLGVSRYHRNNATMHSW